MCKISWQPSARCWLTLRKFGTVLLSAQPLSRRCNCNRLLSRNVPMNEPILAEQNLAAAR
jgi:hypothetical protein